MRRNEKQITDLSEIAEIFKRALVCRLALCDSNVPYIVPLCFGYRDNVLYFHSANEGTKLELLKKNNSVCFELDIDTGLIKADQPCNWGLKYRSVIGFGKAVFINETEQKRLALDIIMEHFSNAAFDYPQKAIDCTTIIKVEIESMTAKKSGYF